LTFALQRTYSLPQKILAETLFSMTINREVFQKGAKGFNARVGLFVPHSFLFAVLLTFAAYLLGIFGAYRGPFEMVKFWGEGFWNFLSFSMQMILMVVTGFSVAGVPLTRKILRLLVRIPRNPVQAVMFVTLVTAVFSWMHWGIGIVMGAFLARETARRLPRIDYPLLVSSAYVGMCAGMFGMFASAPLAVSREGHLLERAIGVIPLHQTSLSTMVLAGLFLGTAAVTLLAGLMYPQEQKTTPPDPAVLKRFDEEDEAEEAALRAEMEMRRTGQMGPGVWLERSRWPVWLISIMGFSYIVYWFYMRGFDLNLNIINFILFSLSLTLHDTPLRFLKSMERSIRAAYGIVVQFPFYAGIQGMFASSGLAAVLFSWIASSSTAAFYPLRVYVEAALVNFFIPTSPGLWEVQGALVVKTAQALQTGIPNAVNAFTAGEIIGNVIQPFWTIPILGICRLSLRDILGYNLLAFGVLSVIWIFCVTFLPV
jgi:short-chain fatty acids transporter